MYDPVKPYKDEILKLIRETWNTRYVSVQDGVVVQKNFLYPEYYHADGIGTKGIYHWKAKTFLPAVIDALAQNLNDLAVVRAEPFALVDHILLPEDNHAAAVELVRHLARECVSRNIALCGGDTAIHDNLKGLEISITMLGFIKNAQPNHFSAGDVLVALASNGLHANGFTKVREIFGEEVQKEFLIPTRIYHDTVFEALKRYSVRGLVHVAGGAFTRLKSLLDGMDIVIVRDHQLRPQPIFHEMYERGVSDEEMYKTFNCGIGFFMGMSEEDAGTFTVRLRGTTQADIVGAVLPGSGKVKIRSQFSRKMVVY